MSTWRDLHDELDRWQALGRTPTFWWRDDDAVGATPALERLMSLSDSAGIPLTIAVVPEKNRLTTGDLSHLTTPVQHGYSHRNHAGPGAKKCELGPERRADHVVGELMTGRDSLDRSFGARLCPVLVPPWNRLAGHLRVMLPELGYVGLSAFGSRDHKAIGGMRCNNAHVDIIDWKGTRGFVGEEAALGQTVSHLEQRRAGIADPSEATGILSHHLVHGETCWAFLERLFEEAAGHGNVAWRDAASLFYDDGR